MKARTIATVLCLIGIMGARPAFAACGFGSDHIGSTALIFGTVAAAGIAASEVSPNPNSNDDLALGIFYGGIAAGVVGTAVKRHQLVTDPSYERGYLWKRDPCYTAAGIALAAVGTTVLLTDKFPVFDTERERYVAGLAGIGIGTLLATVWSDAPHPMRNVSIRPTRRGVRVGSRLTW